MVDEKENLLDEGYMCVENWHFSSNLKFDLFKHPDLCHHRHIWQSIPSEGRSLARKDVGLTSMKAPMSTYVDPGSSAQRDFWGYRDSLGEGLRNGE